MTELTQESLERALMEMVGHLESMEERIILRPTHLIIPPAIYRKLMWRSPIRKARGIRGRKRALYGRSKPLMWSFK